MESKQKLLDFWEHVSSSPGLVTYWPFWPNWPLLWDEKSWMKRWDQQSKLDHDTATGEAARRYYSARVPIKWRSKVLFKAKEN
jgi:hypothetical protein